MLAIVWVLYHLQRKGYLRSSQYIMVFRSTSTVIRLAAMCLYRVLPRICRRLTKEESTSVFHVFSVYAIPCSSQLLLWLSFHLGPVSVRDEQPSNVVSIQHVLKTYMEGICTTYRNVSMLLSWRREQASTYLFFPLGMVTTFKELLFQHKHMEFIHMYIVQCPQLFCLWNAGSKITHLYRTGEGRSLLQIRDGINACNVNSSHFFSHHKSRCSFQVAHVCWIWAANWFQAVHDSSSMKGVCFSITAVCFERDLGCLTWWTSFVSAQGCYWGHKDFLWERDWYLVLLFDFR